jgi:CRP/FNR family transcriptional regulator, anaerobic regulatory protein
MGSAGKFLAHAWLKFGTAHIPELFFAMMRQSGRVPGRVAGVWVGRLIAAKQMPSMRSVTARKNMHQANNNLADIRSVLEEDNPADSKTNVIEALVQRHYQSAANGAGAIATRTLRRGQHLYRPGELSKHVYFIKRGTLKTYRLEDDGREWITGFHPVGKLLGLDTLVARPMRCGAVALDTALLCAIPLHAIVAGASEFKQLPFQLLEQFDNEIGRLEAQLSFNYLSASQRLAHFILYVTGESDKVYLPMSHKEIGNYLRLVPETVSRLFTKFQRCGWISISGHDIVMLDRIGVAQIAAGNMSKADKKETTAA